MNIFNVKIQHYVTALACQRFEPVIISSFVTIFYFVTNGLTKSDEFLDPEIMKLYRSEIPHLTLRP